MICATSEDSDQPGHPPSLIRGFAVGSMGSWGPNVSSCGQQRLWSDWADAQADLSLCWAQRSFCWFCHEVAKLSWVISLLLKDLFLDFQNWFMILTILSLCTAKPTKYQAYSWGSDQPLHLQSDQSLLSTKRNFWLYPITRGTNKDWSNCADATTNQNLHWVQISSCGFCHARTCIPYLKHIPALIYTGVLYPV